MLSPFTIFAPMLRKLIIIVFAVFMSSACSAQQQYERYHNYKRSLKASFYMAIQDDCIRKNPFEFKLSDVLEDDTEQKVILTPEQEERLLAFMEKDKIYSKYYDEVVLLLETGLRISEFLSLIHISDKKITAFYNYYSTGNVKYYDDLLK